jgi:hypothetical protein
MKAGPDASIGHLFGKGCHVGPAVGYTRRHWACHCDFRDVLGSENRFDDAGDCAA